MNGMYALGAIPALASGTEPRTQNDELPLLVQAAMVCTNSFEDLGI